MRCDQGLGGIVDLGGGGKATDADPQGARRRSTVEPERALAQPVTHAVLALTSTPDATMAARLLTAGEAAGLTLLKFVARDDTGAAAPPVLAAAILAEDLAPRSAAS